MASILEARGLQMRFGGTTALRGVDFKVQRGQIVGLVGENGAGKSTLVKILTGVYQPTEGTLHVDGERVEFDNPREAREQGVAVVHQDSQLFPSRRVWENMVVTSGHIPRRGIFVSSATAARTTIDLLGRFNIEIDPWARVGSLPPIERRLLEIARSISGDPAFLFLDEPTAALEVEESWRLLSLIDELRDHGTGIVLVSHHLDEVEELADRVLVLRDGAPAATLDRSSVDHDSLVKAMLGHSLGDTRQPMPQALGPEYVHLSGLRIAPNSTPVDLVLRRGERVGVVGLVGSGASDLLGHFVGEGAATSAALSIQGRQTHIASPLAAIRHGIGYLSQDRAGAGVLKSHSVTWNVSLASLRQHCTFGWRRRGEMRELAADMCKKLSIRATSVDQPVTQLSGGNQQKTLVARWLAASVDMLVVDEPTQGVDIGARADIAAHLQQFAADGGVVLFASSNLCEIRELASRVLVIYRGNLVADLDVRGRTPTQAQLLRHMTGVSAVIAAGAPRNENDTNV